MIEQQPYHESQSQEINQEAPSPDAQPVQHPAEHQQELQNMNVNEQDRPTEQQIRKRKKARAREVEEQEANEFLQQPVVKLTNPNKDLKRAYEKGFLDQKKYDFIKILRKKRRHPEQDSVSSHYNSDESWDIKDALPKRGFQKKKDDILSSSDSGQQKPKKKRGPKPKDPSQPKAARQPRKPKQPKQPREQRQPRQPRKPRQAKSIKQPIKKEEDDKVKQEKQINQRIKAPVPDAEPRKSGVTIKITKAPPGMNWEKNGNNHAKRKTSESEASLNESQSSFKTSSGDESEQKIIAEHIHKSQPKPEEKKAVIRQIRQEKEILPVFQPKMQQKAAKIEEQVEKKPVSNNQSNIPNPKEHGESQVAINSHPKKPEQRARAQVKKSMNLQSNSLSNSSSSEQSSSSSSSSDSSSDSSDEDSKSRTKRRHKNKKHRYSSSDSSSEQKKPSKKHKNKKKHKKDHSEKPSESLITKVVQQQLSLHSKDQIVTDDKTKKENTDQFFPNRKDSLLHHDVQRVSKKVQLSQKELIIERDTTKQIIQNLPNKYVKVTNTDIKILGPEKQNQQGKISEKDNSKLAMQSVQLTETSAQKIEQGAKQPANISSSPIIKPVPRKNQHRTQYIVQASERLSIENAKELKPILKEANSQTSVHIQPIQINGNKTLKKQISKETNQPSLKLQANQKKQKQLALDNKVVVLQLMIGPSDKSHEKAEPNFNETQKGAWGQGTDKRSGQKIKQVARIRGYSSDQSEEVAHYSKPVRASYMPQKVVRYRKVVVESSDDTQSSEEYIRDRRVIRRVRKPVKYQSSVTSSEDEAIDYRVVTYRGGKERRQQYDYRGYR